MNASELPIPGILWGSYPERRAPVLDSAERVGAAMRASLHSLPIFSGHGGRRFVGRVRRSGADLTALSTQQFEESIGTLRERLARSGLSDSTLVEALAVVCEACARERGLCPYDTQILAARIMLDGHLAEMATGEGKTLALALAAATAGLAGIPVHVITANDYLVTRDAEHLRSLYEMLGLSVGAVTQALSAPLRRRAYSCNITYCTAKEVAFDYLRDRLASGHHRTELEQRALQLQRGGHRSTPSVLRGLCFALIDEADSILIDEARVPLILSQPCGNSGERDYHAESLRLAAELSATRHFITDLASQTVELTAEGREKLGALAAPLQSVWRNQLHREETVCLAIAALHLFHRDRHYLVRGGQVSIIDETTSRVAAGRVWSRGLHQLIEIKESCRPSNDSRTAARITFQRFFARYLRVGGMSGTLRESRLELASIFNLQVRAVPLRKPSRRQVLATRVFRSREDQWRAVVTRLRPLHAIGRPVLIGTDSVADSESLSQALTAAGFAHALLNARHDASEAEIVSHAGERGRITVATNMAGRGTDILLAEGVAELGGLHVICCQHNSARRIDRQLRGRCARRGEPGSVETLLSLDSPLIARSLPRAIRAWMARGEELRPGWVAVALAAFTQHREERRQRAQREQLFKQDILVDRRLFFGSPGG